MLRPIVVVWACLVPAAAGAQEKQPVIGEAVLRKAVTKALPVIQKSQQVFYQKESCVSCHHHLLPALLLPMARDRGIDFDGGLAGEAAGSTFSDLKDLDAAVQGYNFIDEIADAWELVAAHAAGVPPSPATSAKAQFLASAQRPDGSWLTIDMRPPQGYSRISTTAVCARAVGLYLPDGHQAEKDARLRLAREWLLKARPFGTEEQTFRLLGLLWTGADEAARADAARQLLAGQRPDGGWSQLPHLASDAYSTGEALSALHDAAGLATGDPANQRGLRFLLGGQKDDGSWRVESRLHPPAPVSPPYFNAGFPHGRNHQYVSIMGSEWAAMALLRAVPPAAGPRPKPTAPPDFAPAEKDGWIRVALDGSADDLRKALDGGMKPNAKTNKGTTALMLAARDPAKVKLLLERGADVNARAESGLTALVVASRHHGNAEVVRLLLGRGAKVNAGAGVKVTNSASAVFFAATNGDREMVRLLLDAGARVDEAMRPLGLFWTNPLLSATVRRDTAMVEYLLERGADPNLGDDDKVTPVGWAALGNHAAAVKALVAKGARVDHVDAKGMTPLLYAASIDYGDTATVQALLAAGADRDAKDERGRTARELAEAYGHTSIAKVLGGKVPDR
ncbi:MAG: ankyrin repeat domain-containing protein [Gemmataceae bacterium]|nr:ankyrin repeat domain-containing protein [Gemmataceae bacterium]